MSPTPAGVGVKGGSLTGDSPSPFPTLRFLGSGVAGRYVSGKSAFGSGEEGAWAVGLRFLGAAFGRGIFVYFAAPFTGLGSGRDGAGVFATRAERRRDIVKCFLWSAVVLNREG